jgi:hypothetical protein
MVPFRSSHLWDTQEVEADEQKCMEELLMAEWDALEADADEKKYVEELLMVESRPYERRSAFW